VITDTSRYRDVGTSSWTGPDGHEHPYLRRRFIPDPSGVVTMAEHTVTQGDRLDNITARYLGDPEQYWRVCDANSAMDPDDLVHEDQIGRQLIIPLPQKG
jgi:hypothetical protein